MGRCVAYKWLHFIDLIQEAGNASGGVRKGEHFVHKLLKIHKYAKTQSELNNGIIDWDVVQGQCARSKPDYPRDFALMMKYVQLWSGGTDDPVLLKMLQDSLRFVDNIRVVRGGVFKQLGELELGPGKGGLLRTAVVMAMAG